MFLYKYMCVRSLNDEYMYYNIHVWTYLHTSICIYLCICRGRSHKSSQNEALIGATIASRWQMIKIPLTGALRFWPLRPLWKQLFFFSNEVLQTSSESQTPLKKHLRDRGIESSIGKISYSTRMRTPVLFQALKEKKKKQSGGWCGLLSTSLEGWAVVPDITGLSEVLPYRSCWKRSPMPRTGSLKPPSSV